MLTRSFQQSQRPVTELVEMTLSESFDIIKDAMFEEEYS